MKRNLQTKFSTRQYMLSKDFEIYYYKDHYVTKVDSHTHGYYEFYFFLEGDVSMEIGGAKYPLKYGDIVLIPPGIPHRAVIQSRETPYRRFVFWISQEYCGQLLQISQAYGYLLQHVKIRREYVFHTDRITFNTIQSRVLRLIEELHGSRFGREAQISLCASDLVLHVNRIVYEQKHQRTRREEQSLYEELIAYIDMHLDEELSLDRVASEFYVSKYHIAHVFKENMGISIHQYIMKKRVDACREAILAGEKISEAYQTFGFTDYSSFFRAFRKEYGMSPKEYRELKENRRSGAVAGNEEQSGSGALGE